MPLIVISSMTHWQAYEDTALLACGLSNGNGGFEKG